MAQPAWSDSDLRDNPHARADKATRVEAMFAAIAGSYDLNNRLHSLGRDQAWRRAAVRMAKPKPTDTVLDAACGTGDLSQAFANAGVAQVTGTDFTAAMLDIARQKQQANPTHREIKYQLADATALPYDDASFEIVSIAFGIRNVDQPGAAFAEFFRVLRPGGRLIVLEFGKPASWPARQLYDFYFHHVMPRTASWIARDRSGAYKYLPKSVSTFIDQRGMAEHSAAAGFCAPAAKPLTFGIAWCYRGVKPVGK